MRTNTKSRPGDHIGMGLENRLGVGVENRMKQVVSRIPAQRPCAHHRARLLGLILTAVPFAIAGDAQACTVLAVLSSFASSSTVDCTGSTSNSGPGPGIGYGTINDINNTYDIHAAATVSGAHFGFETDHGGTFNNSGAVQGTASGIVAGNAGSTTVHNLSGGTITGGLAGAGIVSSSTLNLDNASQIFGGFGINVNTLNLTANTGSIRGASAGIRLLTGTSTINNTSQITGLGSGSGIQIAGNVTLDASGNGPGGSIDGHLGIDVISGNAVIRNGTGQIQGAFVGVKAVNAVAITNDGMIFGGSGGVEALNADVTNSATGQIQSFVEGVRGTNLVTLHNAGHIVAFSTSGVGVSGNGTINIVSNSGDITAAAPAGIAVSANTGTVNITSNTGVISADSIAVTGGAINVSANSGTIEATGANGIAVKADTVNLTSTGEVRATGATATGIKATTVTAQNGGLIQATKFAIDANSIIVANSGTIQATDLDSAAIRALLGTVNITANSGTITALGVGIDTNSVNVTSNSGRIEATGAGGTAIRANSALTVNNSGSISGAIGIQANGANNLGAVITNSGTVTGTGGTAIKLSAAADTLTLLPGSRIVGVIDMGGNNGDVINTFAAIPISRLSSLTSAVGLPTIINFTGTLRTTFYGSATGPSVQTNSQFAVLDPTALAQTNRTLMDFSGGVSSLVQGRLNGVSSANGSMMAMAYAPEVGAGAFAKAPAANWQSAAPITIWVNSFGGQRIQDETSTTLRATSTGWGAAMGIDRSLRPNWLLGAFIGGGSGNLSVDLNSQSVNTDYVFGGYYSRFEWASQFLDATVQGGSAANRSRRRVLNNLAPGGSETAIANYNGWYISPEVAYGFRYRLANDYVLTPTARLRYVAGMFDGYGETGSMQTLSIAGRTLQNLEERGELDVSRVSTFFGGDHRLKTNVHGGVIAIQRVGDASIGAVLVGQNLAFATPGSPRSVGVVFGGGFDYHTSKNVAVFGGLEAMAMSDQSRVATAKGGMRVAF